MRGEREDRRRCDISKWQRPDDTPGMCQICLHPLVLAFMSHLFCWGGSQGQNHPFKTHSRASLSLVHRQRDGACSRGGSGYISKSNLHFTTTGGVCERHITKTRSKIIWRLLVSSHVFMRATFRAKGHCHEYVQVKGVLCWRCYVVLTNNVRSVRTIVFFLRVLQQPRKERVSRYRSEHYSLQNKVLTRGI